MKELSSSTIVTETPTPTVPTVNNATNTQSSNVETTKTISTPLSVNLTISIDLVIVIAVAGSVAVTAFMTTILYCVLSRRNRSKADEPTALSYASTISSVMCRTGKLLNLINLIFKLIQ